MTGERYKESPESPPQPPCHWLSMLTNLQGIGGGAEGRTELDWDENENTKEQLNKIGTSISLPVLYPKKTTLLD